MSRSTPKRSWLARSRALVAATVAAALLAALVVGLSQLGDEAKSRLGIHHRYQFRFADIACDTPPGLDRELFLSEVRYQSRLPETLNSNDPELQKKLNTAFASHPWVAQATSVTVTPQGGVSITLFFRKAVLAVHADGQPTRIVDADAILLPTSPIPVDLPELIIPLHTPMPAAGQTWADETLIRALELVPLYHPKSIEKTVKGWRLVQAEGKVVVVGS